MLDFARRTPSRLAQTSFTDPSSLPPQRSTLRRATTHSRSPPASARSTRAARCAPTSRSLQSQSLSLADLFLRKLTSSRAYARQGSAYLKMDDYENGINALNKSLTEHRTPDVLAKLKEVSLGALGGFSALFSMLEATDGRSGWRSKGRALAAPPLGPLASPNGRVGARWPRSRFMSYPRCGAGQFDMREATECEDAPRIDPRPSHRVLGSA